MSSFKILITTILISATIIDAGVFHGHTPVSPLATVAVAPPIAYTRVAPPSVLPFAASVSTFTKGLPYLLAPYAAGVLPYQQYYTARGVLPSPAFHQHYPVTYASPPVVAAPHGIAAPAVFAPPPAIAAPHGLHGPAFGHPGVAPSALLPAPFGRSVHAVAPGVGVHGVAAGYYHHAHLG